MIRRVATAAVTGLIAASMALPAFAESSSSASSSSSSVSSASSSSDQRDLLRQTKQNAKKENQERRTGKRQASTVDIACVKAAVVKREASLGQAFAAYSASLTEAYADRASALASTWDITDAAGRRLGLKNAWDAFQQSGSSARETLRMTRKEAWKLHKAEVKKCGVTSTGEEGSEKVDDAI